MSQFSYYNYNAKVAGVIGAWLDGIRASFLCIAETIREHGPDLGKSHTRAMGGGLFEVRAKGREGIGRAFYCTACCRRAKIDPFLSVLPIQN